MQDEMIVALYWQRDEKAISETERKYGRYLSKIAYNILSDWEDSKETVNDTYLKAWNSMPTHKPSILSTYLGKITRQLSIDVFRTRNREKRKSSEYAALFCNFYQFDSNTNCSLTELYRVYGIESVDDIASITEMKWNNEQEVGSPVRNRQEIDEFYHMTIALASYGNDDFQAEVFDGIPEENQQEAHTAFADDRRNLRIETASGLRFFISFYPNYDWIEGGGTMSYFKIDSQMRGWIERNLNR